MKQYKKMTHEEHVELGRRFCAALDELNYIASEVQEKFGQSSRAYTKMRSGIKSISISTRSQLDDEYHKVTSPEQFVKEGHVYYKGLV